jgi:hypothetical protein
VQDAGIACLPLGVLASYLAVHCYPEDAEARRTAHHGGPYGLLRLVVPDEPVSRHRQPQLLVPWAGRAVGAVLITIGLVSLGAPVLLAVPLVLAFQLVLQLGAPRSGRTRRLHLVLAPGTVWFLLRHPRTYRRLRGAGLRLATDAWAAHRAGPAQLWAALGRSPQDVRRLLGADVGDRWALRTLAHLRRPRPWELAGLVRLVAAVPDLELHRFPEDELGVLSRGDGPERAIPFLRSAHGAGLRYEGGRRGIAALVGSGMPPEVFEELMHVMLTVWPAVCPDAGRVTEQVRTGHAHGALVRALSDPAAAGCFAWPALPGWARFNAPELAAAIRSAVDSDYSTPLSRVRDTLIDWHPVFERTGVGGLHPALWYRAGFTPEEATAAIHAGHAPDENTLRTMAALRRDG